MLVLTIGLFGLAAIFGIMILKGWLTSAAVSRPVIYLHGLFAAAGLICLAIEAARGNSGLGTTLVVLIVAAIVGFYMFFRDLKGKFSPTWVALIHALVGVGGVVMLLLMLI